MEIRQPARRPATAPAPPTTSTPTHPGPTHTPRRKIRPNYKPLIVMVVVLLVLLGLLKLWYFRSNSIMNTVRSDEYQAVFLTNNQMYFGKIKSVNRDYLRLEYIYYFPAQQNVQNGDQKNNTQNLTLNKLGNELHGPEDTMYIERRQILFWENLKKDSKVSQAIDSQK